MLALIGRVLFERADEIRIVSNSERAFNIRTQLEMAQKEIITYVVERTDAHHRFNKVTKSPLHNAASIAESMLTTPAMISEIQGGVLVA